MTPAEVEKAVNRWYSQEIDHRKQEMEALEKKFYPTAAPKVMAKEQIEASVARQVDDEMQRRSKRNETLQTKHYRDDEVKRLTGSELEDSLRRVYTDAMRLHQENLAKLEAKYVFQNRTSSAKRLSPVKTKESALRLAVPKKKEFTTEDVNRAYGF